MRSSATLFRKIVTSAILLGIALPLLASAPALAQQRCASYTTCTGEWTYVWLIIPVYVETCRDNLVCVVP